MPRRPSRNSEDQLREFFSKLVMLVGDGLQHGYFGLQMNIETGSGGCRVVTVDAGKRYRFVIRDEDLASRVSLALPPQTGAGSPVRIREERGYQ